MQQCKILNLATRPTNKHVRHKFLDRRRIANNLTQRVRTQFPYKRLSWLYDEIEVNSRRISQGSIKTRKWIWQIYSCSRKVQFCGWTFVKIKNWLIRKNYFIFSSWKWWKLLQNWSYHEKSEPWPWERTLITL